MTEEELTYHFLRAIMTEGAEIPNGQYTLNIIVADDDIDVVVISDLQENVIDNEIQN